MRRISGRGSAWRPEADAEVRVLAPARIGFLDRWASDVEGARQEAQRNLVATVAALAKAGIDAEARVGDEDFVQAVEDQLQSYAADEVVLVSVDDAGSDAAEPADRGTPVPAAGRVPPRRPRRRLSAQQMWGRALLLTTWKALPGIRFS